MAALATNTAGTPVSNHASTVKRFVNENLEALRAVVTSFDNVNQAGIAEVCAGLDKILQLGLKQNFTTTDILDLLRSRFSSTSPTQLDTEVQAWIKQRELEFTYKDQIIDIKAYNSELQTLITEVLPESQEPKSALTTLELQQAREFYSAAINQALEKACINTKGEVQYDAEGKMIIDKKKFEKSLNESITSYKNKNALAAIKAELLQEQKLLSLLSILHGQRDRLSPFALSETEAKTDIANISGDAKTKVEKIIEQMKGIKINAAIKNLIAQNITSSEEKAYFNYLLAKHDAVNSIKLDRILEKGLGLLPELLLPGGLAMGILSMLGLNGGFATMFTLGTILLSTLGETSKAAPPPISASKENPNTNQAA